MKDVDKDGYEAKMKDPNLTADEKKKEKALYEAMEMKARRRSLGESSFNLYPGYILYVYSCFKDHSLQCHIVPSNCKSLNFSI